MRTAPQLEGMSIGHGSTFFALGLALGTREIHFRRLREVAFWPIFDPGQLSRFSSESRRYKLPTSASHTGAQAVTTGLGGEVRGVISGGGSKWSLIEFLTLSRQISTHDSSGVSPPISFVESFAYVGQTHIRTLTPLVWAADLI